MYILKEYEISLCFGSAWDIEKASSLFLLYKSVASSENRFAVHQNMCRKRFCGSFLSFSGSIIAYIIQFSLKKSSNFVQLKRLRDISAHSDQNSINI